MTTRLLLLALLTLAIPHIASAQGVLPNQPIRLQVGTIKQGNRSDLAYYSFSFDMYKSTKRPKLSIYSAPTFSLYRESAHTAFSAQGIAATWGLPLSLQVGAGLGYYTATHAPFTAGGKSRFSGLGGKIFARWDINNGLFTEFATIFPVTKRFTSTQISVGKRF
jgi:hypothetical protein